MTAWDAEPGDTVRVLRMFRDVDGQLVMPGDRVLAQHDHLPYDDGHTFRFTDGSVIRLTGNLPANEEVLQDRQDRFWTVVRR